MRLHRKQQRTERVHLMKGRNMDWIGRLEDEDACTPALIAPSRVLTYGSIRADADRLVRQLTNEGVKRGSVVVVDAPSAVDHLPTFIALASVGAIIVPVTSPPEHQLIQNIDISAPDYIIGIRNGVATVQAMAAPYRPELYSKLVGPGLVLFSSGSTGAPKASLISLDSLVSRYSGGERRGSRMISFLAFDHIGGINTVLHSIMTGGTIVDPINRDVNAVLTAVEEYRVEVLPASPTFLNMLLLSRSYKDFNLDSLRTITYGTEPMSEQLLARLSDTFPTVRFKQTYGLTETGILPTKSRGTNELWMKIGGSGFDCKIVNGTLRVRSPAAMIGYLNAQSPIDADGYFDTGDRVVQDGEWIRILGRDSEIINVGGEKVYPAEVEDVILAVEGVADVLVYPRTSPVTGQIVCARIVSSAGSDSHELIANVVDACKQSLERYKVPVSLSLEAGPLHSSRFKKARKAVAQ